jgi:lipoprotein-anchoring transpeptidase ErfK/SrfK
VGDTRDSSALPFIAADFSPTLGTIAVIRRCNSAALPARRFASTTHEERVRTDRAGTCVPLLVAVAIAASLSAHAASVEYRVEHPPDTARDLAARFTPAQLALLEKLNRADVAHVHRLERLVIPGVWLDELYYSPFPPVFAAASHARKLLVVEQRWQAFAAYEYGRLVRWGPVSSGSRVSPTPDGLFHLNWRSRGRHSTVDPRWFMEWYFNFDNAQGLALHRYALPGYPASHGCIRLLERDAIWLYEWGEGGTPLLVVGQYAFGNPPPWRSLTDLARGIDLPERLADGPTD